MAWWILPAVSASLWGIVLFLPWRPWTCAEVLEAREGDCVHDLDDITVLIPARNEEKTIGRVLHHLLRQGRGLKVVLIDDESEDGTRRMAAAVDDGITIVTGKPLPPGWTGKLWALEQGRAYVRTRLTALLDADIALEDGTLATMRREMLKRRLSMLSLMAAPAMERMWEKVMMPAFIYFFKMVYPFSLANRPTSRVAAAAGGCMLLDTRILSEVGGFAAVRGAIIADCSLASIFKRAGHPVWIGLTHTATSLRSGGLRDLGDMIARTAYTQLHYSFPALLGCTAALLAVYWLPVIGLMLPGTASTVAALAALSLMAVTYLPVLRFYRRSPLWSLAQPLISAWYLLMTWLSAIRYWRGERSRWKGRSYPRTDSGLTA